MSNIKHFIRLRLKHVKERRVIKRYKYPRDRYAIDELHDLRWEYDWWAYYKGLKRIDTRRRYYKRVRADAPFASEIPKAINDLVNRIRKTREPAIVLDFSYGKEIIMQRETARSESSIVEFKGKPNGKNS